MTLGKRLARRRHRLAHAVRQRAWELRLALPPGRPPALPPWTGPSTTRPPLLVGGTGRSGTTVTARLLGTHPAYHQFRFELKFLSERGGLCDLVAGRTTIMAFEHELLERWWDRGRDHGLRTLVDRPTLRAALKELNAGLTADAAERRAAGRRFVHRLLDPGAIAAGAEGWIEMTPSVVHVAPELLAMLPDARLIHSIRDGRDVACSVVPLGWGPGDLDHAVDWWARSLDRACTAAAAAPAERVLTVRMEALLVTDRAAELARLRAFATLEPDPAMDAFFREGATAARAHAGRWRVDVPEPARAAFEDRYQALAAGLAQRWGYEPDLAPGGAGADPPPDPVTASDAASGAASPAGAPTPAR